MRSRFAKDYRLSLCALGVIAIISALFLIQCVSTEDKPLFSKFPDKFFAFQVLSIKIKNNEKLVYAHVQRNDDSYEVVFIDPVLQQPLITIKAQNDEISSIYHTDQKKLPFDPKLIMLTIKTLYESNSFQQQAEQQYVYDTREAIYLIDDIKIINNCLFPKTISIRFKSSDKFSIVVSTKELEC